MDFSSGKNNEILCQLKEAIKSRDTKTIASLLHGNCEINSSVLDGHKLLHHVIHYTHGNLQLQDTIIQILKLFLDHGANVDGRNDNGFTALHLAIESRMKKVIDFLISRNADLHVCDRSGNSILHLLVKRESVRFKRFSDTKSNYVVDRALQDIEKIDNWKLKELLQCEKESTDFIRWMILKGLDVDCQNGNGETALHCALKKRELNWFSKVLLEYSLNVNNRDIDGNTPLHIITNCSDLSKIFREEKEELVSALLSKRADVQRLNNDGISPLVNAVSNESLNLLEMFKKRGADFRRYFNNENLLHYLFKSKNAEGGQKQVAVLDFLFNQGCDVNGTNNQGITPLHYAARRAESAIIERLIKCGANINSRESISGFTPLHEAVVHRNKKVVLTLLEQGADVNSRTNKGRMPLHLINSDFAIKTTAIWRIVRTENATSVFNESVGAEKYIMETLIKHGAHVDLRDTDGLLPLQTAILRKDRAMMIECLRFGADINDNARVLHIQDNTLVRDIIGDHLIKLFMAKLPVDDKLKGVLATIRSNLPIQGNLFVLNNRLLNNVLLREDNFAKTNDKCQIEVEILKNYKITDSTSLYDLLHMNRNSACAYVNNEKLTKLIRSSAFGQQFPMYRVLISSTYYMAVERRKMLEPARQAWIKLTEVRLPDLCIHQILTHLSNWHLRLMIEDESHVLQQ